MSGADEAESQTQLIDQIKAQYSADCEEVFVASDTWGALFTATPAGKSGSVTCGAPSLQPPLQVSLVQ